MSANILVTLEKRRCVFPLEIPPSKPDHFSADCGHTARCDNNNNALLVYTPSLDKYNGRGHVEGSILVLDSDFGNSIRSNWKLWRPEQMYQGFERSTVNRNPTELAGLFGGLRGKMIGPPQLD